MENRLRKAYSEVYEILNLMDKIYLNKIPDKVKELINLFNNVDKTNSEKHSYENLFSSNKESSMQETITENNTAMVEYKENIFSKILEFFVKIFRK